MPFPPQHVARQAGVFTSRVRDVFDDGLNSVTQKTQRGPIQAAGRTLFTTQTRLTGFTFSDIPKKQADDTNLTQAGRHGASWALGRPAYDAAFEGGDAY